MMNNSKLNQQQVNNKLALAERAITLAPQSGVNDLLAWRYIATAQEKIFPQIDDLYEGHRLYYDFTNRMFVFNVTGQWAGIEVTQAYRLPEDFDFEGEDVFDCTDLRQAQAKELIKQRQARPKKQQPIKSVDAKKAREEAWKVFKREFRLKQGEAGRFIDLHSKYNISKCNIPGCNHYILRDEKIRHSYETGAICMKHQPQEQAYYAFLQHGLSIMKAAQQQQQQQQQGVMNMMTTTPAASVASAVLYTDGAFRDGVYTWAYVLQIGGKTYEASGSGSDTEAAKMRNIAGELSAAMRGLSQAKKLGAKQVILHHDYTGIADWVSGAWKAKNEHTQKYVAFVKALGLEIEFVKVKGHSGNVLNERCDELCTRELNKAC